MLEGFLCLVERCCDRHDLCNTSRCPSDRFLEDNYGTLLVPSGYRSSREACSNRCVRIEASNPCLSNPVGVLDCLISFDDTYPTANSYSGGVDPRRVS